VLCDRSVAAHIVDIVVREIPLFERAEAQIGIGQLIDRETRFDFHKQREPLFQIPFAVLLPPKNTGASI
jgi:hypothetical protein